MGESGEPREARSADGGLCAEISPIGDALLRNDAPLSPKGEAFIPLNAISLEAEHRLADELAGDQGLGHRRDVFDRRAPLDHRLQLAGGDQAPEFG